MQRVASRGASQLVLWLDCDREGENICFEVLDNTERFLQKPPRGAQQVYRARFSAITSEAINKAFQPRNLVRPNPHEAAAVDALSPEQRAKKVHSLKLRLRGYYNACLDQ